MIFVEKLEPQALWTHFDHILCIPRASGEESRIRHYLRQVAERNGLAHRVDAAGNVIVVKPASPGAEDTPTIILQAPLDMVCEKTSDSMHDLDKDPIRVSRNGEYLEGIDASLGSPSGIGIAAMLAVMEARDLKHPPLELLFTVEKEPNLRGVKKLDVGMLKGRQVINLDSAEGGTLGVAYAGRTDSRLNLPLTCSPAPDGVVAVLIRLSGMMGDHSGSVYRLQRGNAPQLLARFLYSTSLSADFRLADLNSVSRHCGLPREALATLVLEEGIRKELVRAVETEFKTAKSEFRLVEQHMEIDVSQVGPQRRIWDQATTQAVLHLLVGLPHGVVSISKDIPGLVETWTILHTVEQGNGFLEIGLSSRSSVATELTALLQKIRAIAALAGAGVVEEPGDPGWKTYLDSKVVDTVREVHKKEFGTELKIDAVHASPECGVIGKMIPGMDMISIGPEVEFPHSLDKRLKIDSVKQFFILLRSTLEKLASA